MDIKNLDKLPVEAQKKVGSYVEDLLKLYGDEVVSLFVYGSVTGEDFNPKTSDVNLAIVLEDTGLDNLKRSLKIVRGGLRKKINAPLFLTKDYLERSLDSFPIEFIEMKDSRCVLCGDDVMKTVEVKKEDLRIECESQIKGKLLTIKQAYLEQALGHKGLERLIKASFKSLIPVFRTMLRIKVDGTPPVSKKDMLEGFGKEFGVEINAFLEVLKDNKADGKIGSKDAETFLKDFVKQLDELSRIVDSI